MCLLTATSKVTVANYLDSFVKLASAATVDGV